MAEKAREFREAGGEAYRMEQAQRADEDSAFPMNV